MGLINQNLEWGLEKPTGPKKVNTLWSVSLSSLLYNLPLWVTLTTTIEAADFSKTLGPQPNHPNVTY
jgi:hypothetical protein